MTKTIDQTAPIWSTIIAAIFLKEKLSMFEIMVLVCSFSGVLIIALTKQDGKIQDDSPFNNPSDFYIGLACISTTAIFASIISVLTRKMQSLHYSLVLSNYQALATTFISLLIIGEALIKQQPLRFSQYTGY